MSRKVATEAQATTMDYRYTKEDTSIDLPLVNNAEQKNISDSPIQSAPHTKEAPSPASSLGEKKEAVVEESEEEHLNPDEIYDRMGIKVELQGISYSLNNFSEFVKVHSIGTSYEESSFQHVILEIVHPMIQKAYKAKYIVYFEKNGRKVFQISLECNSLFIN